MTRDEKLDAVGRYVLGEMSEAERERFETERRSDAELDAMARRLTEDMQALDDTAGSDAPSERLWARIEAGLAGGAGRDAPRLPASRLMRPVAANSGRWWTALAASVVVAAGLGFVTGQMTVPRPAPVVVAVLVNEAANAPGAIVEAFADNSVRVIPLEDFEVPAGQILEVWTLPDPETGPVSLGTFADVRTLRLDGARLPQPHGGQLYEITLEQAPGSPTGRPTGPVLAKGLAVPAL